jgi:hypothetical protein
MIKLSFSYTPPVSNDHLTVEVLMYHVCIMLTQERQHQQEQIPSWRMKADY